MKILVTGGSGFIGSHIVDILSKEDNEVIVFDKSKPEVDHNDNVMYVDGDICHKTSLDRYIKGCEEVYDCAGVLGTHELVFQTERAIDTNIKGAFNVLQSCLDYNVNRVFHPTKPIFSSYWENTYTISKITAENFAKMYKNIHNMDITILRWMNATGPRQHLYPVRKFIPMAICQAMLNLDIEIYGTGEQTVDIIDVRDIANIAITSTRKGMGKIDKIYDVGTGHAVSCNAVANLIIKLLKSESKIKHIPMRVGEELNTNIVAQTHDELLKSIGVELQYTFEQTIEDCISYMKTIDNSVLNRARAFYNNQSIL